jgi:hypothetical protein
MSAISVNQNAAAAGSLRADPDIPDVFEWVWSRFTPHVLAAAAPGRIGKRPKR